MYDLLFSVVNVIILKYIYNVYGKQNVTLWKNVILIY